MKGRYGFSGVGKDKQHVESSGNNNIEISKYFFFAIVHPKTTKNLICGTSKGNLCGGNSSKSSEGSTLCSKSANDPNSTKGCGSFKEGKATDMKDKVWQEFTVLTIVGGIEMIHSRKL